VLEWNGQSLQGRTFEEVYDVIAESRADHEIEIIVCRPISDVGRPSSLGGSGGGGNGSGAGSGGGGGGGGGGGSVGAASTGGGGGGHGYLPRSGSVRSGGGGGGKVRDRPAVTVTSPASPETLHPSWGKVQVSIDRVIDPALRLPPIQPLVVVAAGSSLLVAYALVYLHILSTIHRLIKPSTL